MNLNNTMSRKQFLRLTAGAAVATGFSPLLAGCSPAGRRLRFPSLNDALVELALMEVNAPVTMQQGWTLYKVLNHLAQTMEGALRGFTEMESAALQAAGKLAFQVFKAQGYMTHNLTAEVPFVNGQTDPIADDGPLEQAYERIRNAISDFQNHTGELFPHFTYGTLSYADWEKANSFHCADHFSNLTYAVA